MIYLDNAATTARKPLSVYTELMKQTLFCCANAGRGGYKKSLRATRAIVSAQDTLAELFNIDRPQNIVFTSNATHALNTAILGTAGKSGHVIVTQMDHNSVLRPVHLLGNFTVVSADKNGLINARDVERAVKDDTRLIVCTHASNVCGTLQPVEEIGRIALKHNIPFLLDASQTAGCAEIDAKKINADMIAFPGHKGLMGPLGTGGLYVRNPERLLPLVTGGTGSSSESMVQPDIMPDKFHSGTMNTPAIAALGKGVEYILHCGVDSISSHELRIARTLREDLMNMSGVRVYGSDNSVATVAFNIDGMDSEEASSRLERVAALRPGFHCAPLAHKALGTQESGSVRASFGIYNSIRDAKKLADHIYRISREAS